MLNISWSKRIMRQGIRWIGEWIWILGTFLRGRVFFSKKYRPQVVSYTDGVRFLQFRIFLSPRVMKSLSWLWGYRLEDLTKEKGLLKLAKIAPRPYLQPERSDESRVEMGIPFNGGQSSRNQEDDTPKSSCATITSTCAL